MLVKVKKCLFVGLQKDRNQFFAEAQQAGVIHFIDQSEKNFGQQPEEIDQTLHAIKIVRKLPVEEQEESPIYHRGKQIVDRILHIQSALERLEEEVRTLKLEMARVEPYGDFSLEDIGWIERAGKRKVQFYTARPILFDTREMPPEVVWVSTAAGLGHYIAINRAATQYPDMVEIHLEKPWGDLKARLQIVYQDIAQLEKELKEYAKYHDFLHNLLKVYLNKYDFETAQSYVATEMDKRLFTIEGWVPVNKIKIMGGFLDKVRVAVTEVAIEAEDRVPTSMQNEGLRLVGEDLVHIYDTPSNKDKDPSAWVLGFFALFFAIIIGDAGYGIIFLALAFWLKYKYPKAPREAQRAFTLLKILSVAVIIWGALTGSYFGIPLGIDHPLKKFSAMGWLVEKKADYHLGIKDATYDQWVSKFPEAAHTQNGAQWLRAITEPGLDGGQSVVGANFADAILLELTLIIGILHVTTSLLRYVRRNWAAPGWILFLFGAFLYFPKFLQAVTFVQYLLGVPPLVAQTVGLQLICVGLTYAFGMSVVQHGLMGLADIPAVIQLFSDILSYLRLYALGFAGAVMASTINSIIGSVPLLLAIVLVIFGHFVNIVMGAASGVIHGLRLNFLEWYHYSFEGGGRLFKPLKKYEIPGSDEHGEH